MCCHFTVMLTEMSLFPFLSFLIVYLTIYCSFRISHWNSVQFYYGQIWQYIVVRIAIYSLCIAIYRGTLQAYRDSPSIYYLICINVFLVLLHIVEDYEYEMYPLGKELNEHMSLEEFQREVSEPQRRTAFGDMCLWAACGRIQVKLTIHAIKVIQKFDWYDFALSNNLVKTHHV